MNLNKILGIAASSLVLLAILVPTTTTIVYGQIILNNTTPTSNATTTTTQPLQQQEQKEEGEKKLHIFANVSTVKLEIISTLNLSDVTSATNYENGTGIVIFKGGPSNTSGIEIRFNHTCIPQNGCIYEDNTISVENNDTQMKAIQTEE